MKGKQYLFLRHRKFTSAAVFVGLLCLTQYLAYQRFQLNKEVEAEEVTEEIHRIKNSLTTLLSNSESATRTLAFVIEKYGTVNTFDSLAEVIISSNKYLDALQLTHGGVITGVYPLAGNEMVLGLDILKDSLAKQEAFTALTTRKLFFAGPMPLRQGGLGVVGRLPIFIREEFYGFAAVVIKFSTFLTAAGIDTTANSNFYYQVSKIDPNTNREAFFLPSSIFSLAKGKQSSIHFPAGNWRIYAKSKRPGSYYVELISICIAGLAFSLAVGSLTHYLLSQPEKLQELVLEQTKKIESSERYFRSLINNIADAVVLLDAHGKTLYKSQSSVRISGYAEGEITEYNAVGLIHPDDREESVSVFSRVAQSPGITLPVSHRLLHKNGHYIWIEGTYANLLNDEVIRGIVFSYRDISHLKSAQDEIARAYSENVSTLNRITSSVISLDNDLRYTFLNDAALTTHPLGREDTIGKDIWEIHPEMRDTPFSRGLHEARTNKVVVEFESYSKPFDKWFLVKIYPSVDGLTLFYDDITNQKRVEEKIRESEQRLAESQSVAKIGSWETDLVSLNVIWSLETYNIFELHPESFRPTHASFLEFVHPDDRSRVDEAFKSASPNSQLNITEHRVVTATGKVKWVEERWYVSQNTDGVWVRAFGTCQDITIRKNAEEQILKSAMEVRKLTVHLEKIREEERTRIAREIHDELGQQLTGLKMDVEWISRRASLNPVIADKLTEMISLLDDTVVTIRRIVSELRPGILDDLGLIPALEWQCKEFEKRTGIRCDADFNLDDFEFDKDLSINLFRIFQEALTNIARHAKATLVTTVMEEVDGHLILTIKDNGVGFDNSGNGSGNSWGLVGMRERAAIFNGELAIESTLHKGTVVTIRIPLKALAL